MLIRNTVYRMFTRWMREPVQEGDGELRYEVTGIDPGIVMVEPEKGESTGIMGKILGKGPLVLSARPSRVVIYDTDEGVSLLASRGSETASVKLEEKVNALEVSREFSISAHLEDVRFAGGDAGYVSLWIPARFLTTGQATHPLLDRMRAASVGAFKEGLARCMEAALGRVLEEAIGTVEYAPGAGPGCITEALEELGPGHETANRLHEKAGLAIVDDLMALDAGVPEVDVRANKEKERKKEAEARREEVARKMGEESARMAMSAAEHEREMEEKRQQTEKELEELRGQQKKEEIRTSIRLEEELADLKKEEKRAEVEKKRRETELLAKKIEQVEGELLAARALEERIDSMEQLLKAMQEDRMEEARDPLGMMVSWRALNESGVIIPSMGMTERLPSGTMLDVTVSVNRDAYVYVLLQNSSDEWQCLVPDVDDIMGVRKKNLQKANQAETWPGVNRHYDPDLPYWCLDREPGYERFIVLASLESIDPVEIVEREGIAGLRGVAAPVGTRGVYNPGAHRKEAASDMQAGEALKDYRRVIEGLVGDGKVMEEMVLEHV
jgi:hypothetical protein